MVKITFKEEGKGISPLSLERGVVEANNKTRKRVEKLLRKSLETVIIPSFVIPTLNILKITSPFVINSVVAIGATKKKKTREPKKNG